MLCPGVDGFGISNGRSSQGSCGLAWAVVLQGRGEGGATIGVSGCE